MLISTLKWREEFKPDYISREEIDVEAVTGKLYQYGHDKLGRPIIVMRPARENTNGSVRLLIYIMEQAIKNMKSNIEQMVWIMDFNGFSLSNAPKITHAIEILNSLSNHYPERLGQAFMVDTPWIFSIFWTAVRPFINERTYSKIIFVSGDYETKSKIFSKYIDLNELEKDFGGKSEWKYDHKKYKWF